MGRKKIEEVITEAVVEDSFIPEEMVPVEEPKAEVSDVEYARELTFGQKAVGMGEKPDENKDVEDLKQLFANIIDKIDSIAIEDGITEKTKYIRLAIQQVQTAAMWVMKAITWKNF